MSSSYSLRKMKLLVTALYTKHGPGTIAFLVEGYYGGVLILVPVHQPGSVDTLVLKDAVMTAVQTITEEILDLKRQRKAMILAHHYQDSEIQEIADSIGDSLELSRTAQKFEGDVIAFCGVVFMAETAKVLNPSRIVVLPDMEAGCSLVDACPADQVRAFRERHPEHVIVSYINTSVEVKAESDILCTSRNA